ncbi:hypothetical protein L9F63_000242 [Diploptera punctata]|uniref:Carboxylesterase type B domain-containing protein n=1 Tax=Diploptera punctata TaxID=6984 RepID=A0AAD8ETL0_DIPPU|nr:hypothetical protein L9F63_000242 [Diploptera punctata]
MARVLLNVMLLIAVICQITANHRVKRIVGGMPAAVPPEDDPVVFVYLHEQDARVFGNRDRPNGYYNFRGIRYAEPPVGRFRFQRARKLKLWEIKIIGSEDCLFLNVLYSIKLPDSSEGLPVLMWIHGGGYRRGSASQYGVSHLVDQKLVVVTIQYRLGSLGFLSAGTKELPGNAGMFDMSLALQWIKDYIKFFGGNPNKITVFGQGTGASSAILLSLSQITQGFLSGVMAMSGSALSAFAIDKNPIATGREVAQKNGCPTSPTFEMVKCLQELPVSALIQADSGLQELRLAAQGVLAGLTGLLGPAPCIEGGNDGRFLPNFFDKSPLDGLKSGKFPKIPLLTGVTRDETSSALNGQYRNEVLENVKKDPKYLDNLVNDIVKGSDLFGELYNRTDELIKNVGSKYFGFLKGDPSTTLNKVVEVTGDSLFNLPAFQMAKMWSKYFGKTFFYSFDQQSERNMHGGGQFLQGLPIVEDGNNTNTGVAHGDDLPFVFDPLSLYGNGSTGGSGASDPNKDKVQNITTQLVAQFARTGEPSIEGLGPWPTFSGDKTNYISISSTPRKQSNFRFCQMALWGGILTQLQSSTCKTFWGITKFSEDALGNLEKAKTGVQSGISSAVNNTMTGNILNVGGLANTSFPGLGLPISLKQNKTTGASVVQNSPDVINTHEVASTVDTQENYINPVTQSYIRVTTKKKPSLIPTPPPLIPKFPIRFRI